MQKYYLGVVVVLLGVGAVIFLRKSDVLVVEEQTTPSSATSVTFEDFGSTPATKKRAPVHSVKIKRVAERNLPANENPYATQPEKNRVEFKVDHGLAIAYGDVILGQVESPQDSEGHTIERGVTEVKDIQLWDQPEIPYVISPNFPRPARIEKALEYLRTHTVLRFVPFTGQTNQKDGIIFEQGEEHCYSLLGRQGGFQPIHLAADCEMGEVMHEVLHALGLVHEQSRTDRSQYVEILWQNIEAGYQDQFAMVPDSFMAAQRGSPFDYHSIMMYSADTFAVHPDLISMRSKTAEKIEPVRDSLSDGDIQTVNHLFDH